MQTVLECRQCGASLDVEEGQKIVCCKYCGSANAVSYADRFGLYNRANHLRRQNEFDRAIGVYEDVLNGDPYDAEAHYGITLCKYGIEYVDDPHTGKNEEYEIHGNRTWNSGSCLFVCHDHSVDAEGFPVLVPADQHSAVYRKLLWADLLSRAESGA